MSELALTDLHCHILPSIDDGPRSFDDALALARAAYDTGTRVIVATPHVNHRYPENTAERITAAVTEMQDRLDDAGISVELRPGAELSLTRSMDLDDEELAGLRLAGGPYLLVECPDTPSAVGFDAALFALQSKGHRILLAHAERISAFQRDPAKLEALIGRGMLVQVTAAAIGGRYGRETQRFAARLLRGGLVHNVASDAHHAERRGPGIAAHLRGTPWEAQLGYLARDAPNAILAGTVLPQAPPPQAARGGGLTRRLFGRRRS